MKGAGGQSRRRPPKFPPAYARPLRRRLMRLSDRCNELLCAAAVFGRQFTAREVAAAVNQDVHRVLGVLEPAVQAGIIRRPH